MAESSPATNHMLNAFILIIIILASFLLGAANVWWGFSLFFLSLPIFVISRIKESARLGVLLAGYALLFGVMLVSSQDIALINLLTGFGVAFLLAIIFFLLLVAVATVGWYRDEGVSFWEVFFYLAGSLFGARLFSVIIDDGKIRGKEKDKKILQKFGGPGRLRVYSKYVVVLHKHGKITRAVGLGPAGLKRKEKVKAIIPLGGKTAGYFIENVMTRDRIALSLDIVHSAGIELAADTEKRLAAMKAKTERDEDAIKRLQEIVDGKVLVGDEYDECYAEVAKLVAAKAPDPWSATKAGIIAGLRDVFMSSDFENLFKTQLDTEDLQIRIDERRIADIEKFVFEKVRDSKLSLGIVLRFVDISEIHFPEAIRDKLKKVSEAKLDEQAAIFDARAIVIRARAEAQKKILAGQSEGEARAAFFRELLRELKREELLQGDELVKAVLGLIGRMFSADDWESFMRATTIAIPRRVSRRSRETNGSTES